MVFSGTSVAAGTAVAVVVATAADTELGKIAGLLTNAGGEQDTPLQKKLDAVGRILVWAALGVVALVFVLGPYPEWNNPGAAKEEGPLGTSPQPAE